MEDTVVEKVLVVEHFGTEVVQLRRTVGVVERGEQSIEKRGVVGGKARFLMAVALILALDNFQGVQTEGAPEGHIGGGVDLGGCEVLHSC